MRKRSVHKTLPAIYKSFILRKQIILNHDHDYIDMHLHHEMYLMYDGPEAKYTNKIFSINGYTYFFAFLVIFCWNIGLPKQIIKSNHGE